MTTDTPASSPHPETVHMLTALLAGIPAKLRYTQGFLARWKASRFDPRVSYRRIVALFSLLVFGSVVVVGGLTAIPIPGMVIASMVGACIALVPPRSRTPLGRILTNVEQAIAQERWTDALHMLMCDPHGHPAILPSAALLWAMRDTPLLPADTQLLRLILERAPDHERAALLTSATCDREERCAEVLIHYANDPPLGLDTVAQALAHQWVQSGRTDKAAQRFYAIMGRYHGDPIALLRQLVPVLIQAQRFAAAQIYIEVLFRQRPDPDVLYTLVEVAAALGDTAAYVTTLMRFITTYPTDQRVGTAWLALGDAELTLHHVPAAITAFQAAERHGSHSTWFAAYRVGEWAQLVELKDHPDWAFPTVVVLDLEVDPTSETAPAGARVFEVGAIRAKGQTELATFQTYIKRTFTPRVWRTLDSQPVGTYRSAEETAHMLQAFIGSAWLVGHNLRAFDALHVRGMGVALAEERILDTLELARCLFPDSLHHHLTALCATYGLMLRAEERHTALPDARATLHLLYALGTDLTTRDAQLLAGIRALVPPASAIDCVLLRPRQLAADPSLGWTLRPGFSPLRTTTARGVLQPSTALRTALQGRDDAIVEIDDAEGAYVAALEPTVPTIVAVASRTRIERIIAAQAGNHALVVLPDPTTLLAAERLTRIIQATADPLHKLHLFCLYQAAHNRDAATLYPLRMPTVDVDSDIARLRADVEQAIDPQGADRPMLPSDCSVILTTHQTFFRTPTPPPAGRIIWDDSDDVVGRIGEYAALRLRSSELRCLWHDPATFDAITMHVTRFAAQYRQTPSYRERILLDHFFRTTHGQEFQTQLTSSLAELGESGKHLAERFRALVAGNAQLPTATVLHAYWLEVDYAEGGIVASWALCGVSEDIAAYFLQRGWNPYQQRIVCGPAVLIGQTQQHFITRWLGIPNDVRHTSDPLPQRQLYLPTAETLPPLGFLNRDDWLSAAAQLIGQQLDRHPRSLIVSLHANDLVERLAQSIQHTRDLHGYQVLAYQLGWSGTRLAEALNNGERDTVAIIGTLSRRTSFAGHVDLEISGPLRFQNQYDPLVAATMRLFATRFPEEGAFQSYLLPLALIELKARLASRATNHLILDSTILARGYRDEVLQLLAGWAQIHPIKPTATPSTLVTRLVEHLHSVLLAQRSRDNESDADLVAMLRTVWGSETFHRYTGEDAHHQSVQISQADIVRSVLKERDQLIIIPTGGGKSLCYQMPAILLTERSPPAVTLIFSPLIALMGDQVAALHRQGIFAATFINSTLPPAVREARLHGIERGEYSIIYLAPEQIHSPALRKRLAKRTLGLVVLDEAHCLSQWGHDFRTDYLQVHTWLKRHFMPAGQRTFPLLAMTATARARHNDPTDATLSDETSTIEDIVQHLALKPDHRRFCASTKRPELQFEVEHIDPHPLCQRCQQPLPLHVGTVKCQQCGTARVIVQQEIYQVVANAKIDCIVSMLNELAPRWGDANPQRQRGLIYCAYTRTTTDIVEALRKRIPGLRIDAYHGQLPDTTRDSVVQQFTAENDTGLHIVVATNAFGMGIDIRRLGFVIHADAPSTLEAYYQEAGRAGRDRGLFTKQSPARCSLLYHPSDLEKQRSLRRHNLISRYNIEETYAALHRYAPARDTPDGFADVYLSAETLAHLAGVKSENIKVILFYLEHHGRYAGQPVIEQQDSLTGVWQLRWADNYGQQLARLPANSAPQSLLKLLQSEEYALTTSTFRAIPLGDLAKGIGMPHKEAEQELLNLVRRQIVGYRVGGQIKQHHALEPATAILDAVPTAVINMFRSLNQEEKQRLKNGETATVHLLHSQSATLTLAQLMRFCVFLASEQAEPLRAFEQFQRNTRSLLPDRYRVQLWKRRGDHPLRATLNTWVANLKNTLTTICAQAALPGVWQAVDIFKLGKDFKERRDLDRHLVILTTLGLLDYTSDPALGRVMHIRMRPVHDPQQVQFNLHTLRQKEEYDKHKLKQIERYVELHSAEEREQSIEAYFHADEPLIQRIDATLRSDLLKQQHELVTGGEGTILIEAPAGCGKTTVLVERVKYLVTHQHVPLEQIMISAHFKNAVGRIERELEVLREDDSIAFVETVNSFGNRIFTHYRELLLCPEGTPYYQAAPSLLKGNTSTIEREELKYINSALIVVHSGAYSPAWWPQDMDAPTFSRVYESSSSLEKWIYQQIKLLREGGIFPHQEITKQEICEVIAKDFGSNYQAAEIYAVYTIYLKLLGEAKVYTFDDQVLFALAILRTHGEIGQQMQQRFDYILLDEFQDFTAAQAELFTIISQQSQNIMVFGDLEQSIRVKETPSERVFEQFRSQKQSERYYLDVHFRSTQEILDLAVAIRDVGEQKKRPKLIAARGNSGVRPQYIDVPTEHPLPDEAALHHVVAAGLAWIEQLEAEERGSVALIVAKADWDRPVRAYLRKMNIGFSVLESNTIYQRSHIANILVYCRLLVHPTNDDYRRLLRHCLVPYLDDQQIETLTDYAQALQQPLATVLHDSRALDGAKVTAEQRVILRKHLDLIAAYTANTAPTQVFDALNELPDSPLNSYADEPDKQEDIENLLKEWKKECRTITAIIERVESEIAFLEANRDNQRLIVTTIDHAKSQEFATVVLIGPNHLNHKKRLYVSVARASNRLALICDSAAGRGSILPRVKAHYDVVQR